MYINLKRQIKKNEESINYELVGTKILSSAGPRISWIKVGQMLKFFGNEIEKVRNGSKSIDEKIWARI